MAKSKYSNTQNLFYVPIPDMSKMQAYTPGSSITSYNHGGSWDATKNLNLSLSPVQKVRINQTLQEWRAAIFEAEHPLIPYRYRMQIGYMDTILDTYIRACIERRENLTILRKFCVKDTKNKKNDKWTQYFESAWFRKFLKYAIGAKWYGYTLVSMGDIIDNDFVNLTMVPRTHISPDRLVVAPVPSALTGEKFMEGEYLDTHIYISTPDEHGLSACGYGMLYELSELAILLKNILMFNTQYAEMFGQPIRVVKTDKEDLETRTRMKQDMDAMATKAWFIMGKDDEFELLDTGKKNGGDMYATLEHRIQQNASRYLLGHPDAIESTPGKIGSSQGKDSPVTQALQDVQSSDGEFIMDIVNNILFPFLRRNGIMVPKDLIFEFTNDTEEQESLTFTNDENVKITAAIKNLADAGFFVTMKDIKDKTGFEIQEVVMPSTEKPTDKKKPTNVVNSSLDMTAEIPMHPNCLCSLIDGEWVLSDASKLGPCDDCIDASMLYNDMRGRGEIENANAIFSKHTGII